MLIILSFYAWLSNSLLPVRMLQAGIVLDAVCLWVWLWVRVSVRRKSRKVRVGNWCNLVEICPTGDGRSDWKLVTFDLDLWPWGLFSYFFDSGYIFLKVWRSNFVFSWRHIFRISRSQFSFEVIGLGSRSLQRKCGSMKLKNYWPEIAGLDRKVCYDNARSKSELLTFWPGARFLKLLKKILRMLKLWTNDEVTTNLWKT